MSESVEFLHFTHIMQDVMTRGWAMWQEETSQKKADDKEPATQAPPPPAAEVRPQAKAKGGRASGNASKSPGSRALKDDEGSANKATLKH